MGRGVKASILVPVYQDGVCLDRLLSQLLGSKLWEVVVVADCPSTETLEILERYGEKVKCVVSGRRLGKAKSLNRALNHAGGDVLVFIDSDHYLDDPAQLEDFVKGFDEECGVVDFKKVVDGTSLLARLVYYDYLGFAMLNWLSAKLASRCIGINGSAFAIKRSAFEELGGFPEDEISEDLGLAFKAYMRGVKFKFEEGVVVRLKAPASWRDWFRQRWRWGHGFALWFKHNYKELLKEALRDPKIVLLPVFFFYPSVVAFLAAAFLPENRLLTGLMLALFLVASRFRLLIPLLFATYFGIAFVKGIVASVVSLVFASIVYCLFARRLEYSFNPATFAVYYYFYSPMWLLIVLVSLVRVVLLGKEKVKDWPVGGTERANE